MSDIQELMDAVIAFRDARDWKQFHKPKDMAIGLSLEAAEVMEHFLWKQGDELEQYLAEHKEDVADELCDVLYWVLLMSHDLNIDLKPSFYNKLEKTAKKYPVEKSSGRAVKWNAL